MLKEKKQSIHSSTLIAGFFCALFLLIVTFYLLVFLFDTEIQMFLSEGSSPCLASPLVDPCAASFSSLRSILEHYLRLALFGSAIGLFLALIPNRKALLTDQWRKSFLWCVFAWFVGFVLFAMLLGLIHSVVI